MKWTVYIVMVVVTFAYLIIGAVVFHFLERDDETRAKRVFAQVHKDFLSNHTCITQEILQDYIFIVMQTQTAGVSVSTLIDKLGSSNGTTEDIEDTGTKWDIPSSILFCITVISTIGYGNMSPKTWNGQLFCIFYAVIGIPMFATVLVGTGERLQIPIKKVRKGRPWIKNNPSRDEKLKSIVVLSVGTCLLVFIPSLVFDLTQNWSYLESVYYTVITLTTVGFGDLVPGYFEKPGSVYLFRTFVHNRTYDYQCTIISFSFTIHFKQRSASVSACTVRFAIVCVVIEVLRAFPFFSGSICLLLLPKSLLII